MHGINRWIGLLSAFCCVLSVADTGGAPAAKPNILWLTAEDINPHLGCYGDSYAVTPNLNRLAARGMIYLNCWSSAPVCAPARTALISGIWPPAAGAEHMRSMVSLPDSIKMYPQLLREAGYYCCNNAKTDYNFKEPDGGIWNECSKKAHYKNRPAGSPFFAVFNHEICHESQIRSRPHTLVHDPALARIPAYHPDTPEVRRDWAQYYDKITEMDRQVGLKIEDLEKAGLADETIIFFFGDNGSGMPRSKRWPYESGLRVPLIVVIPEKYRHLAPPDYTPGGKSSRLVSFMDFAPTLLSLAGNKPPSWMDGRPFMGPFMAPPHEYIFGFRGRMDERLDLVRSVRDSRYIYIRNYMPHKIYGQHIAYMFQTPTTRVWKQLFEEGKLNAVQARFWQPKPPEELYDLQQDPDEVNNLAGSPAHQDVLNRMRRVLRDWLLKSRDAGFLPEDEIHSRATGSTPYEMARDDKRYPLARVLDAADAASSLDSGAIPSLKSGLADSDSAVRYWSALGLLMRGQQTVRQCRDLLAKALEDKAPAVRIVAAEALGRFGEPAEQQKALEVLLALAPQNKNGPYVSIQALNALESLGPLAKSGLDIIKQSGKPAPSAPGRASSYSARLVEHILETLQN